MGIYSFSLLSGSQSRLQRHFYDARYARNEYETVRSESRQGFAADPKEIDSFDAIISLLVKQGQSIRQNCVTNADVIMWDEKNIYNYINANTARSVKGWTTMEDLQKALL